VTRGAAINPANPFERFHVEEDPAAVEELRRIDPEWEPPAPKTAFFVDDTQSLITKNESPDLSFDANSSARCPGASDSRGCGLMWSPPISVGGNQVSWNEGFDVVEAQSESDAGLPVR